MKTTEQHVQDFASLTPEEIQALPWDHHRVVVCEGRYYYGRFMTAYPQVSFFPQGADEMGVLWRFSSEPNTWTLTRRLRVHLDDKVFDSQDRKIWAVRQFTGTEEEAVAWAHKEADAPSPIKTKWTVVKGGVEEVLAAFENAPWHHMKRYKRNDDGSMTEVTEEAK